MFTIQMINTATLLPSYLTFHKGRKYRAQWAKNLPEWEERGKIFVQKSNGDSMMLERADYRIL